MKNCCQVLKELREDKDKTQSEIAQILNISRTQYHLYESGKRQFKLHHIHMLCSYYGVSADYVLGLPKGLDYPNK